MCLWYGVYSEVVLCNCSDGWPVVEVLKFVVAFFFAEWALVVGEFVAFVGVPCVQPGSEYGVGDVWFELFGNVL